MIVKTMPRPGIPARMKIDLSPEAIEMLFFEQMKKISLGVVQ